MFAPTDLAFQKLLIQVRNSVLNGGIQGMMSVPESGLLGYWVCAVGLQSCSLGVGTKKLEERKLQTQKSSPHVCHSWMFDAARYYHAGRFDAESAV